MSDMEQSEKGKSLAGRLAVMLVLVLIMLYPLSMIREQIQERESTQKSAAEEISGKWGASQSLMGPVLSVPYRVRSVDQKGKPVVSTNYAYFLPDELSVKGSLFPEVRYRGIFEALLYTAKLNFSGSFGRIDFSQFHVADSNVLWKDAEVLVALSDCRGIRKNVVLTWNGRQYDFNPGERFFVSGSPSITVPVALSAGQTGIPFSFDMDLNGSDSLYFVPAGKTTHAELSAKWPAPSFAGTYLPTRREVAKDNFKAEWDIFHLSRALPQQWVRDASPNCMASVFGVSLLMPVNTYHKVSRSVKYGILFILLTFMVFFLFEVFSKQPLHPIQYLMVACALSVFYLLLLALSECINFGSAYLIASAAVVALIGGYSHAVLKGGRNAGIMAALLSFLYAYCYGVLQLEDYALLMGAILLFTALAALMYVTRKMDWYNYNSR
ncbi:MAG: cell envelope integrity protein CreD [Elusimicrobiales bacterium]